MGEEKDEKERPKEEEEEEEEKPGRRGEKQSCWVGRDMFFPPVFDPPSSLFIGQ